MRYIPFLLVASGLLVTLALGSGAFATVFAALCLIGLYDLFQRKHSLGRNFPIIGRIRDLSESVRPQIRQYFVECDIGGRPFNREQRSLVYQRSKGVTDSLPFGTERDVMRSGYEWLNHSIAPALPNEKNLRIEIGNDACSQRYQSSLLNISAMSFGALSANAIRALNKGAHSGGFAHDTGEGGLSPYHLENGGDLIWEIGTGYFGCRTPQGAFEPTLFKEKALHASVKMLEIKLSQGAKPGHGGILPAAKVSQEIASTRGVPIAQDCLSPPFHSAFRTPIELLLFIQQLRELGEGKPVGFKLCIGRRSEFLAICKAMLSCQIYPDFIVVDGKEGGTGAAPPEFVDHVGTPLRDGLVFVHNALVGFGVRDKVKIGASGKVVSGFDMAMCLALGADWCNSARGFMFALGCLQSQKCHTNKCPVGVATQDKLRQRALVVEQKYTRVANFHRQTITSLKELTAAAGLDSPQDISLADFSHRGESGQSSELILNLQLEPGVLNTAHSVPQIWRSDWQMANPESFRPTGT